MFTAHFMTIHTPMIHIKSSRSHSAVSATLTSDTNDILAARDRYVVFDVIKVLGVINFLSLFPDFQRWAYIVFLFVIFMLVVLQTFVLKMTVNTHVRS